jgi:hypothetical protein
MLGTLCIKCEYIYLYINFYFISVFCILNGSLMLTNMTSYIYICVGGGCVFFSS